MMRGSQWAWGRALTLWVAMGTTGWAATVNRIVAVVEDEVITEADLTAHLSALWQEAAGTDLATLEPAAARQLTLRRLIEQRLMLKAAERMGISATSEEIAERLSRLRRQFSTPEAFDDALADAGLSTAQLKRQVREQLLIQRAIDAQVRSTIVVSPQEVADAVRARPELEHPGDRVQVSHILIRVTASRPEAAAGALSEKLSRRLREGADFAELARRYSEDAHAAQGGAMGWVQAGELLPELDAVLFRLKEGELSSPIQTRLGFHLVRMETRRPAERRSPAETSHAVQQELYQQKFQRSLEHWLAQLTQRAYIEVVPDEGR
jgi:peptidyl-prolyl cis-trans isomerase SurA